MFRVANIIGTNERRKNAEIAGWILYTFIRINGKQNKTIGRDFNSNKEKWRLLYFRKDECLIHSLRKTKRKHKWKNNESRLGSCVMLYIRLRFKSTVLGNPLLTCQNDHIFAGVTLACSCPEDNKEDFESLCLSLPSACASKQFIRPKHLGLTEPEINVSVSLWRAASNHYLSDKPCHRPN